MELHQSLQKSHMDGKSASGFYSSNIKMEKEAKEPQKRKEPKPGCLPYLSLKSGQFSVTNSQAIRCPISLVTTYKMMTEVQLEENNVSLSPYCKYLLGKKVIIVPITCCLTVIIWKYHPIQENSCLSKHQNVEGYTKVGDTLSCVFSLGFVLMLVKSPVLAH